MPLLIHGEPLSVLPKSYQEFNQTFIRFKEAATSFTGQKAKELDGDKFLYVNQREWAVVTPDDSCVQVMGTDDATTCHMLVIRHSTSGVTGLVHLDGCNSGQAITDVITEIEKMSKGKPAGTLECHIFGGFIDERSSSVQLSLEILEVLIKLEQDLHLKTFVVTSFNDEVKNGVHFPIVYGIGVNVATGEIFNAASKDKSPDLAIRSASHFTGNKDVQKIYDGNTKQITIAPFTWTLDDAEHLSKFLDLPDTFIRRYLSTSPAQEPPHFEEQVKATLKVILNHPQPEITLFPNNKPLVYKRNEQGKWTKI